jgi:plastocyanin
MNQPSLRALLLSLMTLSLMTFGLACGDLDGGDDCDPEEEECEEVTNNGGANNGAVVDEYDITVEDLAFSPQSLTIGAGSSVTWTNTSTEQIAIAMQSAPSGASADVRAFDMLLNPGQSTTLTLDVEGTYQYHARNQPTLAGLQDARIIVR